MSNRGTPLSEGQLARFLGEGTKALALVASKLGPELAANWADNGESMQKAFLSALCPPHLRRTNTVSLQGRTKRFDPKKALKTGETCHVWSQFDDRILSATGAIDSAPAISLAYSDLAEAMNDNEIKDDRPEDYVFEDASVFCAYLDEIIERQKNGEDGDLLINGSANIFYVRGINGGVFAVHVNWRVARGGWRVHADRLDDSDDSRWSAGNRVFSSNC